MSHHYKEQEFKVEDFSLLEPEAVYSYANYLRWAFDERVELIKGKLFKMSPAPKRAHQDISGTIFSRMHAFLDRKPCKIYHAPFDVRFPSNPDDADDQTFTVVQPDICVVCDLSKLDDAGCKGAPDLIVEILSPTTASKDLNEKYNLYEEFGVQEYWVVYPGENVLEIYDLEDGKYVLRDKFVREDTVISNVLKGLEIRLEDVFEEING